MAVLVRPRMVMEMVDLSASSTTPGPTMEGQ
jgi:hypothetical protein